MRWSGLLLAAVITAGCHGNTPSAAQGGSPVVHERLNATDVDRRGEDKLTRCEAQADRLAASTERRDDPEQRPLWEPHYSEKYDQCYVRIDRIVNNAGVKATVSELWEAFDAALLAIHSADADRTINRGYCQVSLSDDPFTSCMVSKFFIDEHMAH